jgi:hypothetical protein
MTKIRATLVAEVEITVNLEDFEDNPTLESVCSTYTEWMNQDPDMFWEYDPDVKSVTVVPV